MGLQGPDGEETFLNPAQNAFIRIQRTTGKRMDQLLSEMCRIEPEKDGEQCSTLMERFGLTADDARFLADLARQADAAAVDRDKQALKAAFTYRDYDRDVWEVLFGDPDRPLFAPFRIVELPFYAASAFVEDCYYEQGALEPLVRKWSAEKLWRLDSFDRLLRALEEAGRFDLIEQFCETIARRTRARFFRDGRDNDAGEAWRRKSKELALEAYQQAIHWTSRVGRSEAAERLAGQRDEVREERLPRLPTISDSRRIDEPVFWEIISRARSQADMDARLAMLEELLLTFKAADIRRFGALYAGYMRKLYHWDVWALAYAARDGCSDDSFAEFRTWLILEGDPALVELALTDPALAARRVPRNPELPDGTLLPMIDEACLQRQGPEFELPTIDLARPKGRKWPEDELETFYPELVRHYASEEACLAPPGPL